LVRFALRGKNGDLMLQRLCILGALMFSAPAAHAEMLLFQFENYPPFTWQENGELKGKLATKVQEILKVAGIESRWQNSTFKRMLRDLRIDAGPFCVAGYGYTEERAAYAQYSLPIMAFSASTFAVRAEELHLFERHEHIFNVLADKKLRGAFIEGASYGTEFDKRLAASSAQHLFVSGEDEDLIVLLANRRVNYAMVTSDQIDYYRTRIPGAESIMPLHLEGRDESKLVYMLCSKSVDPSLIERINTVIKKLPEE